MLFKYLLCDCLKQLIQLFEAILPRIKQSNIWLEQTNTKDLKNSRCYQFKCCYKKVKISYEAVSSSKFDKDDGSVIKDRQIVLRVLQVDRQILRVYRRVLRVDKRVLRVGEEYYKWPVK